MKYLKLFTKFDQQFQYFLMLVKQYSDNIGMKFRLDRCAEATFLPVKLKREQYTGKYRSSATKERDARKTPNT